MNYILVFQEKNGLKFFLLVTFAIDMAGKARTNDETLLATLLGVDAFLCLESQPGD